MLNTSFTFIPTLIAFLVAPVSYGAIRITCGSSLEGMRVTADFDSSAPLFSSTLVDAAQDGPSVSTYLSPKNVCGAELDFATACRVTRLAYTEGEGGDYEFECKGGIAGHVEIGTDSLTFSCSAEDASIPYLFHSFVGCKQH